MGIKNWFLEKIQTKKRPNHEFTDEDRARADLRKASMSIQKQALDMQKRKLERLKMKQEEMFLQQEIEDLESDIYGDPDDDDEDQETFEDFMSPDALFASLLTKIMSGSSNTQMPSTAQNSMAQPNVELPPEAVDVSDEEIRSIVQRIPPYALNYLRSQSKEKQKELINQYMPGLTDHTIDRSMEIINGK